MNAQHNRLPDLAAADRERPRRSAHEAADAPPVAVLASNAFRRATQLLAQRPVATVAAGLVLGAIVGWRIKRR